MEHPHPPADQEARLDQLRHAADMAIAHYLRAHVELGATRADAIERLNRACATMHNDVAIYRRRLLAEIATDGGRSRHLRLVATPAASTPGDVA